MDFFSLLRLANYAGSTGLSGGFQTWRIRRIDAKLDLLLHQFDIRDTSKPSSGDIVRLIHEGKKIEAIRLYRKETGASLAKAKAAVENGRSLGAEALEHKVDLLLSKFGVLYEDDADDEIAEMGRSGRKIEAIKLYRERTGTGLAEAKAAVEALMAGSFKP